MRIASDEAWVREQVAQVLGPEKAEAWLHKPNAHLYSTAAAPCSSCAQARGERVRDHVTALLDANYL